MKLTLGKRRGGMTLIEVLLIVSVLMILAAVVLIPAISRARGRPPRLQCANNLKEIGLSFQIWEADNGDYYPMFIPQTNGGTMEFNSGPNAWRHFQVMSDELIEPKLLICPADADRNRAMATDFNLLSNSNLSYFVGMASNELSARMILSGDHNIDNGAAIKDGVLALTKTQRANWTGEMHGNAGNILLADGGVDQEDSVALRGTVACTGTAENLLQMPILDR
jgi:prepilin-type processing-associated H-X9-DG protein